MDAKLERKLREQLDWAEIWRVMLTVGLGVNGERKQSARTA